MENLLQNIKCPSLLTIFLVCQLISKSAPFRISLSNSYNVEASNTDNKILIDTILEIAGYILSTHQECIHLNFIFTTDPNLDQAESDSDQLASGNYLLQSWKSASKHKSGHGIEYYTHTTVSINSSLMNNKINQSDQGILKDYLDRLKLETKTTPKHGGLCNIVLLSYEKTCESQELQDYIFYYDKNQLQKLGDPLQGFYVIFSSVARYTCKSFNLFKNVVFIFVSDLHAKEYNRQSRTSESEVILMTRASNMEDLLEIRRYRGRDWPQSGSDNELVHFSKIFFPLPDYLQNVITGAGYPLCVESYDRFKVSGMWEDGLLAAMHHVAMDLNATLEMETVLSMPTRDKDDFGEWDAFTSPLIEGEVAFSAVVYSTELRSQVIYMSKVIYYESASFIHALPKKSKFGRSVLALVDAMDPVVWIGIILSILSTFFTLQYLIATHANSKSKIASKSVTCSTTLCALLRPLVDQNGLAIQTFTKKIRDSLSRFVIGLWFMSLIVLGCAYKSRMISTIVQPTYHYPPRTFAELANSDYKIGAIFYANNLELDFAGLHNQIGQEIIRRAVEYPYIDAQCHHLILEGDNVCLGLTRAFEMLGPTFLTDVDKQPMYMTSKDTYFTRIGSIGVSRNQPYCVDILNKYLTAFEHSGLHGYWLHVHYLPRLRNIGQTSAKVWQATNPIFSSRSGSTGTSENQLEWLILMEMSCGSIAGFLCFLLENCFRSLNLFLNRKNRVTVLVEGPLTFDASL